MNAGWPAELPPPPRGVPVIAPRSLDATVDLHDWFRLLGDGIITVASPDTRGAIVVGARGVAGAVALQGDRPTERVVLHGEDAVAALAIAAWAEVAAGSIAAHEVEAVAALCNMTLRSRPIALGCLRVQGFLESATEMHATLALELVAGSRGAVLVVLDGRPRLAYAGGHRLCVQEFLAGAAAAAGSLVLHAHPGRLEPDGTVGGVPADGHVAPAMRTVAAGIGYGPPSDHAAGSEHDDLEALIVEHLGPYADRAPALARAALTTQAAGSSRFEAVRAALADAAPHPLLRSRETALAALVSGDDRFAGRSRGPV